MKPQTDSFELDYEADDEFAAPEVDDGLQVAPEFAAAPTGLEPAEQDDAWSPVTAGLDDFPGTGELTEADTPGAGGPVHELIAEAEAAMSHSTLPRITIHVFCAHAETAQHAERAAVDRRMERVLMVVKMGGLAAACALYQTQPTPSLVMVESLDSPSEMIALLDQLAEVCDPGTKVVVLGSANDISLYRELMGRGVSEYLVPPFDPLQIASAINGLYADPSAPFVGRQIAFCGAKGGSGSSTIAHNVAYSITERLLTGAVLVDFDLPFGTAGLDFNQDPLQGIADALGQPDRLDSVLMDRMMARCSERLSLFAAPALLDIDYDIGTEAYEEVTQKIRSAAPYVVLDLPHVWTAWKRKILLSSDDLVIVATPDLASLRNAKNMVDLVRRARPNDAPPRLVLNQVGVPGRPEIPIKDFGEALGLTPALALPFDPKLFGQAANTGQMLAEVGPKSRVTEGIDYLAQQIARRDPPPVQKTSIFSSLFKRK